MRSTARLVQSEYEESIETAMLEEQAAYVLLEPEDQPINGIDIMTDARHGHRRNAKDTSVVALGARTNKVLVHEHVTKTDDPVTQRHELIGTKRMYNHLADNDMHVRVHTHDMNTSVNAWIRNEEPDVTNQNERWHGIKGLKAQVKKVTSGAKKNIGKTWHPELEDKLEPLSTHAYYAIDHCNGNPSALRMSLLNAVEHYKNNHSNCFSTSRCKTDPNYEPSRIVITSQKAEALLVHAIQKSMLYRFAQNFVLGRETAHVESFNNTMNMFHDKRSFYGKEEYALRSHIAVMHWNENVGRAHTSVWEAPHNPAGTRGSKSRRTYKAPTYEYRDNVWERHMDSIHL